MDYHQNARLTVYSREQIVKMVVERGCTRKAAAAAFYVSDTTAAKWVRRYRDRSRPHRPELPSAPLATQNFIFFIRTRTSTRVEPLLD